MGAVGIAVAAMFLVAGPAFNLGIQQSVSIVPIPRVYALSWESNLYASFLGMCAFFALEAARGPRRAVGLAMLALVLIGFPLGVTRGAYIGLAAGVLAYAFVRLALERRPLDLPRFGAIAAALVLVGIAASNVLLPNALERGTAGPGPGLSLSRGRPRGLTSTPEPYQDTIAFRLERVPIALNDLRNSPLIGFGAESFGQRHPGRYAAAGPDHIAILAVVVPYEAGIIGAAALVVGFACLLTSLWKSARRSSVEADWRAVGAAAAFIGSLVSVLVAYQSNNALHLAVNWIVIGAAAALAGQEGSRNSASSGR